MGMPGFGQILAAVDDAWQNRREAAEQQADQLTQALASLEPAADEALALNEELLTSGGHKTGTGVRLATRRVRRRTEIPACRRPSVPAASCTAHRTSSTGRHGAADSGQDGRPAESMIT